MKFAFQGAREEFESYYRKQRRKQARLALQPPPNLVGLRKSNQFLISIID